MSKYINVNALIRIFDTQMSAIECLKRIQDKEIREGNKCQCAVHFDTKLETFNNVLKTIDEIQGAGVAPVVHATWVRTGNHFNYLCSKCRYKPLGVTYKFCPNCGSKLGFYRFGYEREGNAENE